TQDRLHALVAAEAVDAPPGGQRERGHAALLLDAAEREQEEGAAREEVRLALEAVALVDGRDPEAGVGEHLPVVVALAGARGGQVGEGAGLLGDRLLGVE